MRRLSSFRSRLKSCKVSWLHPTQLWCNYADQIRLPQKHMLQHRSGSTCCSTCLLDHILQWWKTHTESQSGNNTRKAVTAGYHQWNLSHSTLKKQQRKVRAMHYIQSFRSCTFCITYASIQRLKPKKYWLRDKLKTNWNWSACLIQKKMDQNLGGYDALHCGTTSADRASMLCHVHLQKAQNWCLCIPLYWYDKWETFFRLPLGGIFRLLVG